MLYPQQEQGGESDDKTDDISAAIFSLVILGWMSDLGWKLIGMGI